MNNAEAAGTLRVLTVYSGEPMREAALKGAAALDREAGLLQALGLLSTLAPSVVVNIGDPVAMAKEIEATVMSRETGLPTMEECDKAIENLAACSAEDGELHTADESMYTLASIRDLEALFARCGVGGK